MCVLVCTPFNGVDGRRRRHSDGCEKLKANFALRKANLARGGAEGAIGTGGGHVTFSLWIVGL